MLAIRMTQTQSKAKLHLPYICVLQGARLVVRARYACLDTFTTLDVCIQQRLAVSLSSASDLGMINDESTG